LAAPQTQLAIRKARPLFLCFYRTQRDLAFRLGTFQVSAAAFKQHGSAGRAGFSQGFVEPRTLALPTVIWGPKRGLLNASSPEPDGPEPASSRHRAHRRRSCMAVKTPCPSRITRENGDLVIRSIVNQALGLNPRLLISEALRRLRAERTGRKPRGSRPTSDPS